MIVVALLAPLLGLAPTSSPGQAAVGVVDAGPRQARTLEDARIAFDSLRLEDAVALLEPLVTATDTPGPIRARAWLLLGQTRASLVDDAGAAAAFAAALSIDPTLTLPADTSPKVRALLERTRTSLLTDAASASRRTTDTGPAAAPTTPLPAQTTTTAPPPTTTAPPTATATTAAAPPDDGPWAGVLTVTGTVLVVGAAAAGIGAAVADDALGRPVAGRSRAEYEEVRTIGLASLGGSVVLAAAGAATLVAGALWWMPTEAAP